jgi:glycosyltransferase involved in cell wall biosynthesis
MNETGRPPLPPILHLNTARSWRGGESQTLLLCRGLRKRGYQSLICCPKQSPLDVAARSDGIETVNLPLLGEWDFFSALRLAGIIKKRGIGILHLQTAHAHAVGLLASPFIPGCRIVLSRRVDFHINRNFLSRIKYRTALDRIICVSEGVKRVLVSDGVDPGKCDVVYDGVDLERFKGTEPNPKTTEELGLDPEDTVIGTIGALAPHKDLFNLIEAAVVLRRDYPRLKVLIAGEGELYDDLVRFRDERGLGEVVRFLGFRRDVPEVFGLLRVFVLSSYLEGLSSTLLDAMASGTPIVATRTGGVPEIVEDGVNGLLAPPRDSSSLAAAVNRLLTDGDLALKLALAAAEFVRRFSADAMVDSTIKVYNRLENPDSPPDNIG